MELKNNMMCDLETGVCEPAGEESSPMQFIDLSAPAKTVDLVNQVESDDGAIVHQTK